MFLSDSFSVFNPVVLEEVSEDNLKIPVHTNNQQLEQRTTNNQNKKYVYTVSRKKGFHFFVYFFYICLLLFIFLYIYDLIFISAPF